MQKIVSFVFIAVFALPAQAGLWNSLFGTGCVERVPRHLCAMVYDEDDCGGWKLDIPLDSRMDWPAWSPTGFWYRNDIESIVVRAGCTFTGWDDSFSGKSITIRAPSGSDKKINTRESDYDDLHEDIESLHCFCDR